MAKISDQLNQPFRVKNRVKLSPKETQHVVKFLIVLVVNKNMNEIKTTKKLPKSYLSNRAWNYNTNRNKT